MQGSGADAHGHGERLLNGSASGTNAALPTHGSTSCRVPPADVPDSGVAHNPTARAIAGDGTRVGATPQSAIHSVSTQGKEQYPRTYNACAADLSCERMPHGMVSCVAAPVSMSAHQVSWRIADVAHIRDSGGMRAEGSEGTTVRHNSGGMHSEGLERTMVGGNSGGMRDAGLRAAQGFVQPLLQENGHPRRVSLGSNPPQASASRLLVEPSVEPTRVPLGSNSRRGGAGTPAGVSPATSHLHAEASVEPMRTMSLRGPLARYQLSQRQQTNADEASTVSDAPRGREDGIGGVVAASVARHAPGSSGRLRGRAAVRGGTEEGIDPAQGTIGGCALRVVVPRSSYHAEQRIMQESTSAPDLQSLMLPPVQTANRTEGIGEQGLGGAMARGYPARRNPALQPEQSSLRPDVRGGSGGNTTMAGASGSVPQGGSQHGGGISFLQRNRAEAADRAAALGRSSPEQAPGYQADPAAHGGGAFGALDGAQPRLPPQRRGAVSISEGLPPPGSVQQRAPQPDGDSLFVHRLRSGTAAERAEEGSSPKEGPGYRAGTAAHGAAAFGGVDGDRSWLRPWRRVAVPVSEGVPVSDTGSCGALDRPAPRLLHTPDPAAPLAAALLALFADGGSNSSPCVAAVVGKLQQAVREASCRTAVTVRGGGGGGCGGPEVVGGAPLGLTGSSHFLLNAAAAPWRPGGEAERLPGNTAGTGAPSGNVPPDEREGLSDLRAQGSLPDWLGSPRADGASWAAEGEIWTADEKDLLLSIEVHSLVVLRVWAPDGVFQWKISLGMECLAQCALVAVDVNFPGLA
jgi:hypothetical protein